MVVLLVALGVLILLCMAVGARYKREKRKAQVLMRQGPSDPVDDHAASKSADPFPSHGEGNAPPPYASIPLTKPNHLENLGGRIVSHDPVEAFQSPGLTRAEFGAAVGEVFKFRTYV